MIEKNNKKHIKKYDLINFLKSDNYNLLNELIEKIKNKYEVISYVTYESSFFLPLEYEIIDNCPTCGYRTPQSNRRYNYKYIESALFYKLDMIKQHNIKTINCYNNASIDINEYNIIYKILDEYDIDMNIKITKFDELELIKKYNFKSLIINPENKEIFTNILKNEEITKNHEIILELNIYNPKKFNSNIDLIHNLKNLKIDYIEIKGYDPFIDNPLEYNPQYTREYLLKTISILKLSYPYIKLKIPYATNERNYFNETLNLGINTITGIIVDKNTKIYNYNKVNSEISNLTKKNIYE